MLETHHQIAIEAVALGKCYEIYDSPSHRLWQGLALGKKKFFREFWAIRDVNLTIKRGETFGIVGRNGAGKSTLLQLISGILTPTKGTVKTYGRVSALLELGAGLNPEFNGMDNIRMSATILGMPSSELERKIEKIIEFAALGEFIQQPVKHYSSGMVMRLAFAVAIHFDPDILIVDEALAVGDELFQLKCIRRIQELKENGTTILFVSHSTHMVNQICDRAVLIDKGRAVFVGAAKEVSERYTKLLFSLETTHHPQNTDTAAIAQTPSQEDTNSGQNQQNFRTNRPASEEVRPQGYIAEAGIVGHDYRNLVFQSGDQVKFHMRVNFRADTPVSLWA
jgi:lipopolysaccharide transport system ATP-binding protein